MDRPSVSCPLSPSLVSRVSGERRGFVYLEAFFQRALRKMGKIHTTGKDRHENSSPGTPIVSEKVVEAFFQTCTEGKEGPTFSPSDHVRVLGMGGK